MWEPHSSGFQAHVTPSLRDELVVVSPEEEDDLVKGSASPGMDGPSQFGSHGVRPDWYHWCWTASW